LVALVFAGMGAWSLWKGETPPFGYSADRSIQPLIFWLATGAYLFLSMLLGAIVIHAMYGRL